MLLLVHTITSPIPLLPADITPQSPSRILSYCFRAKSLTLVIFWRILQRPREAENSRYGNLPEPLIDLAATLKSEPGSNCPVTNPDPSKLHLSRAATQREGFIAYIVSQKPSVGHRTVSIHSPITCVHGLPASKGPKYTYLPALPHPVPPLRFRP